jgi:hypothetical protein
LDGVIVLITFPGLTRRLEFRLEKFLRIVRVFFEKVTVLIILPQKVVFKVIIFKIAFNIVFKLLL